MSKLKLTKEEKELFKGKEEQLRDFLNAKAVLEEVKEYNFEENEKIELEYLTSFEKVRYYIAKKIENKISVSEEEITKVYSENKEHFDKQNVPFSEAREIIGSEIVNQQVYNLEAQEIGKLMNEMEKGVELTKNEILFSNGNGDILRNIITNKVVLASVAKTGFEKENKKNFGNIENNVLANFYLDVQVRKTVQVTFGEIEDFYNKEKEQFNNITQEQAYNQIADYLLNIKLQEERTKLISEIAEKYEVEKAVKKFL